MTKRSKVYDDVAMVVIHDLGYISRSGFDCSRSCGVPMTECARIRALKVPWVMRCCTVRLTTKGSEIYVDAAMFVRHLEC